MKKISAILSAFIMCFSLAACDNGSTPASGANDPIVIGGIGPLTGTLSIYGEPALNAAKLYFEEKGTLLGRPIEFITLDDKGDVVDAVNAFNKHLEQNKAVAIVGAITSKPTSAVAVEAQKAGLPIISPSATAEDVTTYGDNIFRTCFLDNYQSETLARYAVDNNLMKTAILYDNGDDYSTGLMDAYTKTYEALGGTVVESLTFKAGDSDYNAQLTRIAAASPDVLYIPAYYTDIAQIAQQAKTIGITAVLMGADGWDGVLDVIADASAVEGAVFTGHFLPTDSAATVKDFVTKYNNAYGKDPNAFAALGYDSAAIICKAIEDAGSTDSAEIVKAIKAIKIAGVTSEQEITFDEKGNPVKGITLIQIKDGVNTMLAKYESE